MTFIIVQYLFGTLYFYVTSIIYFIFICTLFCVKWWGKGFEVKILHFPALQDRRNK